MEGDESGAISGVRRDGEGWGQGLEAGGAVAQTELGCRRRADRAREWDHGMVTRRRILRPTSRLLA